MATRDIEPARAVVSARRDSRSYVRALAALASSSVYAGAGVVREIVWDEAGGYPKHSWGYVQYTVRPYRQGYGCDGTSDDHIHFIAATVCERLGIDYEAAHVEAYPNEKHDAGWVALMLADDAVRAATVVPDEITPEVIAGVLGDLYDVNNRSLVDVLEEKLEARCPNRWDLIWDAMHDRFAIKNDADSR